MKGTHQNFGWNRLWAVPASENVKRYLFTHTDLLNMAARRLDQHAFTLLLPSWLVLLPH